MRHIYSIYIYTVFIFLILPLALLLILIPSLEIRRAIARAFCKFIFFVTGIKLKVDGLTNLPDVPCIVIANHTSYLDGIILMASLPPRFSFVIKREITKVPILHLVLKRIQSHFVERTDRKRAAQHLKSLIRYATEGNSLGIFPEGTFTAEPGLRTFQKGAFAVAHKTNLALVPVFITGARLVLPAEEWKLTRATIKIDIQKPVLNPADYETVNELRTEMHQYFTNKVGHI